MNNYFASNQMAEHIISETLPQDDAVHPSNEKVPNLFTDEAVNQPDWPERMAIYSIDCYNHIPEAWRDEFCVLWGRNVLFHSPNEAEALDYQKHASGLLTSLYTPAKK